MNPLLSINQLEGAHIFDNLLAFAKLPFNNKTTNSYRLYKIIKNIKPEYSYKFLIHLLWSDIKEFIDLPAIRIRDAEKNLAQTTVNKPLEILERDVKILYNNKHNWLARKKIYNSYGFKTPTLTVSLNKTLTRFEYDRQCHKFFNSTKSFELLYSNDRRMKNFVLAILQSEQANTSWKLEVLLKFLHYHYKSYSTYEWPKLLKIKKINDVLRKGEQVTQANYIYSKRDSQNDQDVIIHTVLWHGDLKEKNITVEEGEVINFINDEAEFHDVISTDKNWKPLTKPTIYIEKCLKLNVSLRFDKPGIYLLRDNYNPTKTRLRVVVQRSKNNKIKFEKIMRSNNFLIEMPGFVYTTKFKKLINGYVLAESVLRKFTWRYLRCLFLPNHIRLVEKLNMEQLYLLDSAKPFKNMINYNTESKIWQVLINDICLIILSNSYKKIKRSHKRIISKWYHCNKEYALGVLCNNLNSDGTVKVKPLLKIIYLRSLSGIIHRYI